MSKTDTNHKTIAAALVAAQINMGPALKQSTNPHFRKQYADLGNVMKACLPALGAEGIAVIQPPVTIEGQHYVDTVFIHSSSGEKLECRVPLIVDKNNMQGYGSASTYARRYGLMAMAGIAPEDDDGNTATANPPKSKPAPASTVPAWKKEIGDVVMRDAQALNDAFISIGKYSLSGAPRKEAWDWLNAKAKSIGCSYSQDEEVFVTNPSGKEAA